MVRQADYSEVAPFKSRAARDHVAIAPTRGTYWFVYQHENDIVGVEGVIKTPTGGRLKAVWVKPEFRGRGYGKAMTDAVIDFAVNRLMMCRLEVFADNVRFYEGLGFRRFGVLPNGAVKLARNY